MDPTALDREFTKRYRNSRKFRVWLDRQIRPTIGATVKPGEGSSRPEVGDATFSEMLQVLSRACQEMIPPDLMSGVYITYSMGKWQRSRDFHLKFHLSTAAFLALTDALCERDGHSLGRNTLHDHKKTLEEREGKDNRSAKLNVCFKNKSQTVLESVSDYHIAFANELDYPLIYIYQIKDGSETTLFSAADLPNALSSLERYVSQTMGEEGYSIGMVATLPPPGPDPTPAEVSYQAAAVIEEEHFARLTGKTGEAVKQSWGWKEPKRAYHSDRERSDHSGGRRKQRKL